jgi:sigma-B regulation protein RsbU (phosphoserine phosphatase)
MDLRAQLARQQRLLDASYALHQSLDLDELLRLILATASSAVGADRGTVYVLKEDGKTLWSRVVSGDRELEITLPVGEGIAGTVAATGECLCLRDAYDDPRFDRSWDEKSGYRTREVLCAPIRDRNGKLVGVFQLLNKLGYGEFTEEDQQFLAGLSVHAALAIENARLHKNTVEKERYDREVSLARGVQRHLQPESYAREIGGISVAGLNEMCEDATGDYYDCLMELPGGRVAVAIGDVSGHGLQAALVMAEARAYLRAFVRTTDSLATVLRLLNDALVPDLTDGRFITLFAAVIDPNTGAVEWCNAGHNPPLHRRSGDGSVAPLKSTDPMIGIIEDRDYHAGEPFTLKPGDSLLLYTDGVTEARNATHELLGEPRLEEWFAAPTDQSAELLLGSLRRSVGEWTGGVAIDDDLTMIVVRRAADA